MKRIFSLLAVSAMVVALLSTAFSVQVAAAEDAQKTRAIAIVFDNSGSMYMRNTGDVDESSRMAWCRATYAMEVFATTMNKNDELTIYPMHPIEVNGKSYSSTAPLKITQANAKDIRAIYTPNPLGTPIETIEAARKGLATSAKDEKWLIVLTDGASFYKNNVDLKEKTVQELNKALTTCRKEVNVAYLGIGVEAALPSKVDGSNQYLCDKAKDSTAVLEKLTQMCNAIFGRDTLPVELGTNKISFDVSMKKLILFVQGTDIADVKLGNAKPTDTAQLKYAEKGGGKRLADKFRIDKSLQGVMLTYGALDAGDYTLSFKGSATSIVAYYEPNVDLKVVLRDAEGTTVTGDSELNAGAYTMEFGLVDKDGKSTKSPLLGKVSYLVEYAINGEKKTAQSDGNGNVSIELQHNDTFDATFTVTYLSGYTIRRTGLDLGWPQGGFRTLPPPAGKLEMTIGNGPDNLNITELDKTGRYPLQFVYENEPLSADKLGRLTINPSIEGGNATCKVVKEADGYYLTVGAESLKELKEGTYTVTVSAIYTTQDNLKSNKASAKKRLSIVDNSGKLEMAVEVPQDYYQISKLKDGKPLRVNLTMNGKALTEQQHKDLQWTVDDDGLKLITERVEGQSAYTVRIDPDSQPKGARYNLSFNAKTKNEIGREVAAQDVASIQVRKLSALWRTLLPLIVIFVLALLVTLFMRQKVLPNSVEVANVVYTVGGQHSKNHKARVDFSGKRKKQGSLTITPPPHAVKQANCGVTMQLKAKSRRYVKSSNREVIVTEILPTAPVRATK